MSWEVTGIASAGEDVRDLAGAVEVFVASVRRIQEAGELTALKKQVLADTAREMRALMLTEGRAALEAGSSWSAVIGDVRVLLTPRDESARPLEPSDRPS